MTMIRRALLAGFLPICALALITQLVAAKTKTRPGTLVAITNDGAAAGTGTMISVDRATAAGALIAVLDAPGVSLAFSDPQGTLYASFTIRRPAALAVSRLATVDPDTGAVTDIGDIVDAATGAEYIVGRYGFHGRWHAVRRRGPHRHPCDH